MVKFSAATLIALVFCAISVAGSPSVNDNVEIETRSAELAELVRARDVAYSIYQARDFVLNKRAQQLAARRYDVEGLIFPREKTTKKEIQTWLKQGSKYGAAAFGDQMAEFHSAGTSLWPHCRPSGQRVIETRTEGKGKNKKTINWVKYIMKLRCAKDRKKTEEKVTIVSPYILAEGEDLTAPSATMVYSSLMEKVNDMSRLPF